MKAFSYDGELYIRAVPSKKLFNSTMVHEVVNRGDIFALRVSDQQLTIVPGKAEVVHTTISWQQQIVPAAAAQMLAKQCLVTLADKIAPFMYQPGDIVQVYRESNWVQNCRIIECYPRGHHSASYCAVEFPDGVRHTAHVLAIKRVSL